VGAETLMPAKADELSSARADRVSTHLYMQDISPIFSFFLRLSDDLGPNNACA
jgi:hypothetical protein